MKVETDAVYSRFLKVSRDGAEVTSTGRSFHVRAPATRKARRPIVGFLTAGTSRSSDEEDRSLSRDGITSTVNIPYVNTVFHCLLKPRSSSFKQIASKTMHLNHRGKCNK